MSNRIHNPERVYLHSALKGLHQFTHASPRELLDHFCQQEANATSMKRKSIKLNLN